MSVIIGEIGDHLAGDKRTSTLLEPQLTMKGASALPRTFNMLARSLPFPTGNPVFVWALCRCLPSGKHLGFCSLSTFTLFGHYVTYKKQSSEVKRGGCFDPRSRRTKRACSESLATPLTVNQSIFQHSEMDSFRKGQST